MVFACDIGSQLACVMQFLVLLEHFMILGAWSWNPNSIWYFGFESPAKTVARIMDFKWRMGCRIPEFGPRDVINGREFYQLSWVFVFLCFSLGRGKWLSYIEAVRLLWKWKIEYNISNQIYNFGIQSLFLGWFWKLLVIFMFRLVCWPCSVISVSSVL